MVEELNITTSEDQHSLALVKVVFRRQGGFHVVTVFVQTMVIIIVAFVTFFFHVRNFTDRIMVNLVLLLVLATINSTVQNGVPKTSYYKMIDLWFLFLLVLVVLTIVFHTAITFILGPDNPHYSLNARTNNARLFKHREVDNESTGTNNSASRGRNLEAEYDDYEENVELAKKTNLVGMIVFIIIIVVFNIVFWVMALSQQSTPVREFLDTVKDTF